MSDARGITVLGICGSLRKGSYNMAALRTAIELKPPGMTIEVADISQFPLYNEDVRAARLSAAGRDVAAADQGGRRAAVCLPRIQLLDVGRAEERDRLGLAPARSALCRQAGGDHGRRRRDGRQRARAIRSAPQLRLSRHAPDQQARGADRPGADQIRRRWRA